MTGAGAPSTGWTGADSVQRPVVGTWPVMGTVLQLSAWDADTARALAGMEAARAAVFRVDTLTSAGYAASEVSLVNRRAGTDSATTLSPWTAVVLDSAMAVAALAGARGDPAVDPVLGWAQVRLDRVSRRALLPRRGMRLDVGEIARGFALDRALDALRAAGVRRAVVDLGGDFAMMGAAPMGPRWSVALRNPFAPADMYAAVQMDSGAVATLGEGEIARPRTREPAGAIASVSVIAPSGILSSALVRAFFEAGPAGGCLLAARYPGVDAIWVRDPGPEEREEAARDADDGVEPDLVVITDALVDRLELLSEEPTDERPTRCSQLLSSRGTGPAAPRPR